MQSKAPRLKRAGLCLAPSVDFPSAPLSGHPKFCATAGNALTVRALKAGGLGVDSNREPG